MPSETNESRRDVEEGLGALVYAPPVAALATSGPAEWSDWSPSSSPLVRPIRTITLALIGGQRLLREATANLLTAQDGLNVLGTFESAAQFLAADGASPPAVLLLDCDGGGLGDCQSAVGALNSSRMKSRIVLLCGEICEEVVRCAIAHRVSGVLLKSYSTEDIRAAIRYTATGRTVMPAGLAAGGRPAPGSARRAEPASSADTCPDRPGSAQRGDRQRSQSQPKHDQVPHPRPVCTDGSS